jgi:ubiquinone biosynthesis protein COQ4
MNRPLHAVKALLSVVRLIKDPNRLGEVFSLADHLFDASTAERRDQVVREIKGSSPEAARAFDERPRIGPIDLSHLARLPKGTLGEVFAHHMLTNELDPSSLPLIPSDTEVAFLRAHLYETHDIWHAVTGFDTDVASELGLQAFYLAQFPGGLPAAILGGGFFNTLIYKMDERDARMRAIVRGWLLGKRAKPFFGVRWADLWSVPMEEVRRRLGVQISLVDEALPGEELARAA